MVFGVYCQGYREALEDCRWGRDERRDGEPAPCAAFGDWCLKGGQRGNRSARRL